MKNVSPRSALVGIALALGATVTSAQAQDTRLAFGATNAQKA